MKSLSVKNQDWAPLAKQSMKQPMKTRDCFTILTAVVLFPLVATAIPVSWNPDPTFPDYNQLDPGVNDGPNACAEVATTDSFFWLSSKYNLPNLIQGKTWQGLANTLEQYMHETVGIGTCDGNFVDGKIAYINSVGYGSKLKVEYELGGKGTAPTIPWIEQMVAAGQDVEVGVAWIQQVPDSNAKWLGEHFVAVTEYDANNLICADPMGGQAENLQLNGSVQTTLNTDAYNKIVNPYTLTYPQVTINDDISYPGASYEIIVAAAAESPVPEPATFLLLGLGGLALMRKRR